VGAKSSLLRILVLSVALCLPAAVAQALPVWLPADTVVATAGPEGGAIDINAMVLEGNSASTVLNGDGSFSFLGGSMTMTGVWTLTWSEIKLDPDPIVSFAGGFTNASGSPQDFVFSIVAPVIPALGSPTRYGGQTIVTYLDANLNGSGFLKNDSSGNPAYIGTIDSAPQLNMLLSLNLVTSATSQSETQGIPGPTLTGGPAVTANIGIIHYFSLSPGDQGTFNSVFQVVPEPGTVALFATGLLGLLMWGRRRSA
jgi:hypothetical protein